MNYLGLVNRGGVYTFRNGTIINANSGMDASTIAVIYFKNDYSKAKDGWSVIDIGANIGVYSIFEAESLKDISIYAFEPFPETYELLIKNIKSNNLENVIHPFNVGVAQKKEKRKLYISDGGSPFNSLAQNDNKKFVEIECLSLADIMKDNKITYCDLLKLDCEGAEYEILYSTPDEVYDLIGNINFEYHHIGNDENNRVDRLIQFLQQKKYEVVFIKHDGTASGIVWLKKNV